MAQPRVHGAYGGKAAAGTRVAGARAPRRDPQLMADPAHLDFGTEDALDPRSPRSPASPHAAFDYDPAFVAAATNPNVVYSNGRAVYVPTDPIAVVREQYCLCAPKTDTERRLMVVVLVLAVVSLALLITLVTLLPNILGSDDCKGTSADGCGSSGGVNLFDMMRTRLEDLLA